MNILLEHKNTKFTIGNRWIFRNDEYYNNRFTLYNIDTCRIIYLNKGLYAFFKLLSINSLSFNDLDNYFKLKGINFDWDIFDSIFSSNKFKDLFSPSENPYFDRFNPYFIIPKYIQDNEAPTSTTPIEAEIHLTHKCNLKCLHCFQESERESEKFQHLSVKSWIEIFNQFEDINLHNVTISGGEPLFYKGFNELIQQIVSKRLTFSILTNGILINDKNIDYLCVPNVNLSISLDGHNAEIHDLLRGKGAFDRVIISIKKLIQKNAKISISTTIHKYNYRLLRELVLFLIDIGVQRLGLVLIEPMGRAERNNWLILSNDDIKYINESIKKIEIDFKNQIELTVADLISEDAITNDSVDIIYCSAGTKRIAISADGLLYPCVYAFGHKELIKGDLSKEKIIDIWNNNQLWEDQRGKIKLKDLESCKSCQYKYHCSLKNCRIKSYGEAKNLYSKPNYCLKDRIALT